MAELLDDRSLNRATLARQLLLGRSSLPPADAVEHLVGLQAQNPLDPYLALWSRLDGFDPAVVGRAVEDRSLVRIVVMRGTIHLVTAGDGLALRPLVQPVLDAEIARHPEFARHLVEVDMGPVLAFARSLLAERPSTGAQLRLALAEAFPDEHAPALAYACRCLLPLVQVPPRGVWGTSSAVTSTPIDAWLGRSPRPEASIDEVVLRYLAAFGPATVADASAWSRLTGLREVVERLRPRLRTFRHGRTRELFDLPDGPRPDADTPAPVRLLPEYDNLLLSHADRRRFAVGAGRSLPGVAGPHKGTLLVDGFVHGIWRPVVDRRAGRATLAVEHLPLPPDGRDEVEEEARAVARFWLPEALDREVELVEIG